MARRGSNSIKERHIGVRVSLEDYCLLMEKAHSYGATMSAYLRDRGLSAPANTSLPPRLLRGMVLHPDLQLLATQLRKVGVNLNQMVRHCHTLQVPPPAGHAEILEQINVLLGRIAATMDGPNR